MSLTNLGLYPAVGFHFLVTFLDPAMGAEIGFQSVSGLSVEYETETIKVGGENRFEYKLPVRTKYNDIVLKRGIMPVSMVSKWVLDALEKREIAPKTITISLLNDLHLPLHVWTVNNAWPKKWSINDFNAQENSIVVESLELCYTHFTKMKI